MRGCTDGGSYASACRSYQEGVAQAMFVLRELDAANVLVRYGLLTAGVGVGDGGFGDAGEES